MAPAVIKKPTLTLQCDWQEAVRDENGEAWVTCKEMGKPGIHSKLHNAGFTREHIPIITASDGFTVQHVTKKSVNVSHKDPNCHCLFVAPQISFSSIHNKSVVGLDVTKGGLGVSVCTRNILRVWDTATGEIRRDLKGHVWDVYTCRFFPSGVVVLSGGADMQLKIWSAETGQCPVTLTGHTAAIVDSAIVDQGRNIVSVSKDGTARLWDCGQASCLATIHQADGSINCCALNAVTDHLPRPDEPPGEREVGTEGKLLLLGCESNRLSGVGLQSRKEVFAFPTTSAVNSCCFLSPTLVVFGTQDGMLNLLDLRNTSEAVMTWEESASSVLSLLPFKQGFFAGRADGTCSYHSPEDDETIQLTGPDCDPIYCIAYDGTCLYTASRDSQIRKYLPILR